MLRLWGGGFAKFNKRAGWANIKPSDYSEKWAEVWGTDDPEEINRRTAVMNRGINPFLRPVQGAQMALAALSKKYELVVLTSRPRNIEDVTRASIDRYFPGIFADIKYLENGWGAFGATEVTKGETAIKIGASVIVDDQPKHAIGMARAGGIGLLFGKNKLTQQAEIEDRVIKTPTWQQVIEYSGVDLQSILPKD